MPNSGHVISVPAPDISPSADEIGEERRKTRGNRSRTPAPALRPISWRRYPKPFFSTEGWARAPGSACRVLWLRAAVRRRRRHRQQTWPRRPSDDLPAAQPRAGGQQNPGRGAGVRVRARRSWWWRTSRRQGGGHRLARATALPRRRGRSLAAALRDAGIRQRIDLVFTDVMFSARQCRWPGAGENNFTANPRQFPVLLTAVRRGADRQAAPADPAHPYRDFEHRFCDAGSLGPASPGAPAFRRAG